MMFDMKELNKKIKVRISEIERDLDKTEKLFKTSKNSSYRKGINNLRWALIKEMHQLKYTTDPEALLEMLK